MNFAVDQPVIRTFSSHLRFFQLALQTLVAQFISRIGAVNCSTLVSSAGQPIAIALLIFNLIALLVLKFSKQSYSKRIFWGAYAFNLLLSGIVMIIGLLGIGEANSCANNKVLHRFVGFQSMLAIILSLLTFFTKYDFGIRYTNGPGNLTWVFLFFSFTWTAHFKSFFILAGVINLLITIVMLSTNVVHMVTGFSASLKKIIYIAWVASLVAMIIAEVIVFMGYVSGAQGNTATDVVAKKLAQVYLPVNIIDALFWIFGLITLRIRFEDNIYETALTITEGNPRTNV